MDRETYIRYAGVTRGQKKAPLVLKHTKVINVFTEEIIDADIAIMDGYIVGVGTYCGEQEIDLKGLYVCPGFIDSHLHMESTMVTPAELVWQAASWGTTTFIVDPHEAANVSGLEGIEYILEQTKQVPANVYVMMPSCVPATDLEDNGVTLDAQSMEGYVNHPRILGLAEVMDYKAVVEAKPQMHEKLALFEGKIRDGHAPFLQDKDLATYVLAGISTDHECTEYEYAMKQRRLGMTVLIREGSAAKNLEAIVKGIVEHRGNTEGFCFCTDDKHVEEIQKEGHINFNVKKAIQLGIPPIQAIKMATLNPARCYGLPREGAISVGYEANLVIFEDLQEMKIHQVYYKGEAVLIKNQPPIQGCKEFLKQTLHIKNISKEQLVVPKKDPFHVIHMEEGQITTKDLYCEIPGNLVFEPNETYQKITVIERHKGTGKLGVGVVSGFHLQGGAIASSVSHDSHNVIVIGDNDEDMILAVEELIRSQGGYSLVCEHKVYDTLELPVMGLMSEAGHEQVNRTLKKMIKKAHEMGVPEAMEPFLTLAFMALPVIPEIRITPRGLYNVVKEEFYS